MLVPLVMTIISPDRTGLVEAIARAVADHGGNWLESRMCRLGGEFAGILRIEIPEEKRDVLLEELQILEANGVQIVLRADRSGASLSAAASGQQAKLEVVGADRPGIVREISSALARSNVNVEEFSSEITSAPMSGEPLFKAGARLQLPPGCNLAALKRDLEKIAADLLVDVSFEELARESV
jgi:glycine cleavage system regulatory protein